MADSNVLDGFKWPVDTSAWNNKFKRGNGERMKLIWSSPFNRRFLPNHSVKSLRFQPLVTGVVRNISSFTDSFHQLVSVVNFELWYDWNRAEDDGTVPPHCYRYGHLKHGLRLGWTKRQMSRANETNEMGYSPGTWASCSSLSWRK